MQPTQTAFHKAVVVHRGARDAYQVAAALAEAGLLERLVTDLYWPNAQAPAAIKSMLLARHSARIPSALVQQTLFSGGISQALDMLPKAPFSWRRRATRWTDAVMGRQAGELAARTNSLLLTYSYYAYHAFSASPRPGMLFQAHPHPASVRAILRQELADHPECAESLKKEWELSLPADDFERLAQETQMAGYTLAASSFTRRTLIENGTAPATVSVIPYGIDLQRFAPPSPGQRSTSPGKLRLLFVGIINQRKGIKYLLEALKLTGNKNIELTVCGRVVDDLSIFKPFASQVTVRPSISFPELVNAYQQSDLFVFPSVAEGFAQVLLEALACGLPILSTTNTAAPDLIDHGIQGFVVEPRRPDLLAQHMQWAFDHPAQLNEMRAAARTRAEHFTWERLRAGIMEAVTRFQASPHMRNSPKGSNNMFEPLVWTAVILACVALFCALDGSRDVFHPLVFIAPMLAFIYGWMPLKLIASDGLTRFFDNQQLVTVQSLNVAGILAFVVGCLAVGARVGRQRPDPEKLTHLACSRLRLGAVITGGIGLTCWLTTIINVGGFVKAFSTSYTGGWDDSGYVRDGGLLLLVGVMLMIAVIANEGPRIINLLLAALFGGPWLTQALLTARRGPTFALVIVVMMSWYMFRGKRPPVLATAALGLCLGWVVLFLVANRGSIYLGSDFDVKTDVTENVSASDTGNEFVYGTGSVISTERHGHYFWMRRYLAQVLVRPIPSAIWETKYEDFGVPELLHNAGTGDGIADTLGWEGAVGSAPGIIADLFIEVSWGAVLLMALLGCAYGWVWKKAVTSGAGWISQYVIISALSIYLVMQTMEAVIFRTLLLSIPAWLVWNWALRAQAQQHAMAALSEAEHLYSEETLFDSGSVHVG